MKQGRYTNSSHWIKGNTHLHSTASDGGKTFNELADLYKSAGYGFLFRTDHWVASETTDDDQHAPILWLDGIEIDGQDEHGSAYHVVCLGNIAGIQREDGFDAGLRRAQAQGALCILAHPHWMGNSKEEVLRWNFDGIEVYNHVCNWLNGKGGGLVHWEEALKQDADTLAFAVDDAHIRPEHPGWNGGWIMVNAEACTPEAILSSIRRGDFYSSCGPEFKSIDVKDMKVSIETSPVQFIRLVGPRYYGQQLGSFDGATFRTAEFSIPEEWAYAYIEIEDDRGKRAWTNTIHNGRRNEEKDE